MSFPFGKREFTVEALSPWRVADKLARAGIAVFSLRVRAKNSVTFSVNGKDAEKAFAILRNSCYNVKKVRPVGLASFLVACRKRAGLIAGMLFFLVAVSAVETRVLKIDVTGSGAYYRGEVMGILRENGVCPFSAPPKSSGAIKAKILALPRVSFVSTRLNGGIFTVTVEVTDEEERLNSLPLVSPLAGVVEELVVLRGTPCVAVGDSVEAGQMLVSNVTGEASREIIVIARARIAYPFRAECAGSEAEARVQAEFLFGALKEIHTVKTETGWSVYGTALKECSVNF